MRLIVTDRNLRPSLIFSNKALAYTGEFRNGHHSKGRLRALLANIRLRVCLTETNALAYNTVVVLIVTIKSFTVHGPAVSVLNLRYNLKWSNNRTEACTIKLFIAVINTTLQ